MIDLMPLSVDQEPENASSELHIDWLDDDWEVAPNVLIGKLYFKEMARM